jgi:hypothetical protein
LGRFPLWEKIIVLHRTLYQRAQSRGLSQVPKQKKKEKLGQFSGSKPSGLSPQRALFKFREALDVLIMTSASWVFEEARPLRVFKEARPLRVFKEARPLRVFKEARPDFGPFGTECGSHN